MYLHDTEIRQMVQEHQLIENFREENLGCIAYDLTVSKIYVDEKRHRSYTLRPGEAAFIAPEENIHLPNDCFGVVIQRNSCIRAGLTVTAPVYQPGHHTKVFFRVQNISKKGIYLEMGKSIASIMFCRLSGNVGKPYSGVYAEEFDYSGIGDFHSVAVPEVEEIEEKIESIQEMEKSIYNNVLVMMTIFIALFSLINFNINILGVIDGVSDIIVYNLMSLSAVAVLISLVSMVISRTDSKQQEAKRMMFWSVVGLAASVLIFFGVQLL